MVFCLGVLLNVFSELGYSVGFGYRRGLGFMVFYLNNLIVRYRIFVL